MSTAPRSPAKAAHRKAKADTGGSVPAMSRVDKQIAIRRRGLEQKNPPAAALPPKPTVVPVAVPAPAHPAYAEANARALEFTKIAAFARKQGLDFDMAAAMGSGMSADVARTQVINAMAELDEASPTICTPTTVSAAAASNAKNWNAANAKVAKRLGYMAPGQ